MTLLCMESFGGFFVFCFGRDISFLVKNERKKKTVRAEEEGTDMKEQRLI